MPDQRFISRDFKGKQADQAEGFLDGPLRSGHGPVKAIQLMFTIPLPPREQLCNRSCSNKYIHVPAGVRLVKERK